MIKYDKVEILISRKNISHFRNLGYPVVCGEKMMVDVLDMKEYSHVKIIAVCDICGAECEMRYEKYNTNKNRCGYYGCRKCCKKKRIILSNEKYGVDNPGQLESVKEKIRNTCLERYGYVTNLIMPETMEQIKKTNNERYGHDYAMQNVDIFEKNQKTQLLIKYHEEMGIKYQGTYEEDFLNYCIKNNIIVDKLDKTIEYNLDRKKHHYHPDFYLIKYNLIVEIKSSYYYKKHLKKNLAKRKSTIKNGYKYIFIINKDYTKFDKLLKKYEN